MMPHHHHLKTVRHSGSALGPCRGSRSTGENIPRMDGYVCPCIPSGVQYGGWHPGGALPFLLLT